MPRSASFTYRHMAFPEIDRNEFRPVTDQQLANDHNDRLAFNGVQRLARRTSLHGIAGVWTDEDEDGADAASGGERRAAAASLERFGEFGTR